MLLFSSNVQLITGHSNQNVIRDHYLNRKVLATNITRQNLKLFSLELLHEEMKKGLQIVTP